MVGNGSMAWAIGTGVRRRHSAPHAEELSPDAEPVTGNPVLLAEGTATDAPRSPIDTAIARDGSIASTRTHSDDNALHVRFSADVERPTVNARQASSSSADGDHERVRSDNLHNSRRPNVPDLSVDTGLASYSPNRGNSTLRSAPIIRSSSSLRSFSPFSARSPGSRNRGYSLRRSILSRGLEDDMNDAGSVVELERIESSSSTAPPPDPKEISIKGKGIGRTTISVSPALPIEPPSVVNNKLKDYKAVSGLPHYEQLLKEKAARTSVTSRMRALYERAHKFILRVKDIPPSKDGRHIEIDATRQLPLVDERTAKPYIDNTIRSSRYNAWNFLPRQLFAQFSRLANFYFLLVSILQLIPGLSTTGTYTTIVPLMFFVSISIAKEGYDDFRRYRLDKEENNRSVSTLNAGDNTLKSPGEQPSPSSLEPLRWRDTKWEDVQVGDIVRVRRDEAVPADLLLLHSNGDDGVAYVETMALDGETNLKSKQTLPSLAESCTTTDALISCHAQVVVEDPNLDLYHFEGRVIMDEEIYPLTNTEIIYRGSVLRNTPEAFGLVIYSGEECKIRMNATKNPRVKAPTLQTLVNRIVIVIVCFVLALALFNTIAYEIWASDNLSIAWYLDDQGVPGIEIFVSFIILFNTMIPLSLYVSLEIIKVVQMILLNDIDMYDPASDTPLEARTSTINEELGQVNYIFSDKTGTLTDNSMKFRKISIAGTAWLHDPDLQLEAMSEAKKQHLTHKARSKGKRPARKGRMSTPEPLSRKGSGVSGSIMNSLMEESHTPELASPVWKSSARPMRAQLELQTAEMIRYMQHKPFTVFARKARFFILSIALCHTCLPEAQEDGKIGYQAASPDELALVQAAQEMGYIACDRRASMLTIKTYPAGSEGHPVLEEYEILDYIEFSSKRKRMSVIVRLPDQRTCIICKGADSVVTRLLRLSDLAIQKTVEIESRTSKRKSQEAERALARRSSQFQRRASSGRGSFHVTSPIRVDRTSISSGRFQLRDELNTWLAEREQDVVATDDASAFYTPRPSANFARRSFGHSDNRLSAQDDGDYYELVEESLVVDEPAVMERCFQHVNDFATDGLRTLLYGYRFLDPEEYVSWKKVYRDATTSLIDRQEMIERAGDLIEKDFELAGATAIEDKLQKGVPEAIDKLRRANIKMWMLTGDKRETAINIGHSCRLIKDYSKITVLDHEAGYVEQHMASAVLEINDGKVAHSVIVIDGQTLAMVEASPPLHTLFLDLAVIADSVICCRASPSQKASLVKSIRKKVRKSVTLAVGDGANDIAMIQEAHVGIGITGKEGLQAARTSDYSIAQFRFLLKLLLVHGRWNYIRTCKYIVATFWKEMMFYLVQAFYQRWNGYTGTSLYENWSLSMFNTLFTSLPVIFLGIFEKDLHAATLLAIPELYVKGQCNGGFNFKIYLWWTFLAASEACIIYFCVYCLFGDSTAAYNANTSQDLFPLGDLAFSVVIVVISSKLLLIEMHNRSLANAIAMTLSVGGWALWNVVLSAWYSTSSETPYNVRDGLFARFGNNPTWWLTLLVSIMAVVVLELSVKALKAAFMPSDTDVFQALEKDPAMKTRFEEASAMELQLGWESAERKRQQKIEKKNKKKTKKNVQQTATQADNNANVEYTEVEELLKSRLQAGDGPAERPVSASGVEAFGSAIGTSPQPGSTSNLLRSGVGHLRHTSAST